MLVFVCPVLTSRQTGRGPVRFGFGSFGPEPGPDLNVRFWQIGEPGPGPGFRSGSGLNNVRPKKKYLKITQESGGSKKEIRCTLTQPNDSQFSQNSTACSKLFVIPIPDTSDKSIVPNHLFHSSTETCHRPRSLLRTMVPSLYSKYSLKAGSYSPRSSLEGPNDVFIIRGLCHCPEVD